MREYRFVFAAILILSAPSLIAQDHNHGAEAHVHDEEKESYYTCPMHPEIIQDGPGSCPICNMPLVQVFKSGKESADGADSEIDQRAALALKKGEEELLNLSFVTIQAQELKTTVQASGRAVSPNRVYLQVPESDTDYVSVGTKVSLASPSLGTRRLLAKVVSVDSSLEPMTRTLRVLADLLPGQKSALRSESSIVAYLDVARGQGLLVPEEAVLRGATTNYVFSREKDKLVPRKVDLGRRFADSFEVLGGLKEGDNVLSHGSFLIDSESRLRGR